MIKSFLPSMLTVLHPSIGGRACPAVRKWGPIVRSFDETDRDASGTMKEAGPPFGVAVDSMESIVACKICGLVQRLNDLAPRMVAECARCGSRLRKHEVNSLARTAAFSLAALMFYV